MLVLDLILLLITSRCTKRGITDKGKKWLKFFCWLLIIINAVSIFLVVGLSITIDFSVVGLFSTIVVILSVGLLIDVLCLVRIKKAYNATEHTIEHPSNNATSHATVYATKPELKNYGKFKRVMLVIFMIIPMFLVALALIIDGSDPLGVAMGALVASLAILVYIMIARKLKDKDLEFYQEAKKRGIMDPLHSEDDFERLRLLARAMPGYRHSSDKQIRKLFAYGQTKLGVRVDEAQQRKLTDAHKADVREKKELEKYSSLSLRDKAVKMLSNEWEAGFLEAKNLKSIAKTVGAEVKESNSAMWGGIAQGIGGIGAGIAAYIDVENKNEEIREYNAQTRDQRKAAEAKKMRESNLKMREANASLNYKGYVETALISDLLKPGEAAKYFTWAVKSKEVTEGKSLRLSVELHCPKDKIEYRDKTAVFDGTLNVNVSLNGKTVDFCRLVLPSRGLAANGVVTREGLCTNYAFSEEDLNALKIDITSYNTWLMQQ